MSNSFLFPSVNDERAKFKLTALERFFWAQMSAVSQVLLFIKQSSSFTLRMAFRDDFTEYSWKCKQSQSISLVFTCQTRGGSSGMSCNGRGGGARCGAAGRVRLAAVSAAGRTIQEMNGKMPSPAFCEILNYPQPWRERRHVKLALGLTGWKIKRKGFFVVLCPRHSAAGTWPL